MFINDLKSVVAANPTASPAYLRSLLKERLQHYVLQFISGSPYSQNLLFKGGTCLRFFFDLPRLSEDLDFDVTDPANFSLSKFEGDVTKHFASTLQFKQLTTKLAGNGRTLYLKFPVLDQILPNFNISDTPILFIRFDVAPTIGTKYQTDISTKSIYTFKYTSSSKLDSSNLIFSIIIGPFFIDLKLLFTSSHLSFKVLLPLIQTSFVASPI